MPGLYGSPTRADSVTALDESGGATAIVSAAAFCVRDCLRSPFSTAVAATAFSEEVSTRDAKDQHHTF